MEYYEYHYIIKDLIQDLENEQKANQGEKDMAGDMMGKMKMPNMQMPKMSIPKMG